MQDPQPLTNRFLKPRMAAFIVHLGCMWPAGCKLEAPGLHRVQSFLSAFLLAPDVNMTIVQTFYNGQYMNIRTGWDLCIVTRFLTPRSPVRCCSSPECYPGSRKIHQSLCHLPVDLLGRPPPFLPDVSAYVLEEHTPMHAIHKTFIERIFYSRHCFKTCPLYGIQWRTR